MVALAKIEIIRFFNALKKEDKSKKKIKIKEKSCSFRRVVNSFLTMVSLFTFSLQ